MYTINGSLEEVAAFLEGFYSGVAKSSQGWEAAQAANVMMEHACKKLGAKPYGWRELFKFLREQFESDDEGFYRLCASWARYRREHHISSV
jgi:translation initiation factor 2 alpha subunit (eIF-2alpha)